MLLIKKYANSDSTLIDKKTFNIKNISKLKTPCVTVCDTLLPYNWLHITQE